MSARRVFRGLGFVYFAYVTICSLAQLFGGRLILEYCPGFTRSDWYIWALSMVPMYLIAAPLSLPWLQLVPAAPAPEKSRLSAKQFFGALLVCFGFLYPGMLVGNVLSAVLSLIFPTAGASSLAELVTVGPVWLTALFTVIAAPVLEELVFRKLICDRAAPYGELNAILLSGLMFGLFHCNVAQFFYASMLGCVFAFVYLRTRRIVYTMALHALVNFIGTIVPSLIMKGMDISALLRGDLSAIAGAVPNVALLLAHTLVLIALCVLGVVIFTKSVKSITFAGRRTLQRPFVTTWLNPGLVLYAAACLAATARAYI